MEPAKPPEAMLVANLREVSEDVGQVTTPEGAETLEGHGAAGAVHDATVWTIQDALSDHLILVLNQEFYTLNWSSGRLGDTSSDTGEHKVLEESKLLATH